MKRADERTPLTIVMLCIVAVGLILGYAAYSYFTHPAEPAETGNGAAAVSQETLADFERDVEEEAQVLLTNRKYVKDWHDQPIDSVRFPENGKDPRRGCEEVDGNVNIFDLVTTLETTTPDYFINALNSKTVIRYFEGQVYIAQESGGRFKYISMAYEDFKQLGVGTKAASKIGGMISAFEQTSYGKYKPIKFKTRGEMYDHVGWDGTGCVNGSH